LRADLSAKAVAAARAVNYVGAGTVEFIFDNDTQKFFFMEMWVSFKLDDKYPNCASAGILGCKWNTPSQRW
jgi:hypothetical protein